MFKAEISVFFNYEYYLLHRCQYFILLCLLQYTVAAETKLFTELAAGATIACANGACDPVETSHTARRR